MKSRLHGPAWALLLAAGFAVNAGCDDVTCVFTTGCQSGGSGAISGDPAFLPVDGVTIVDGRPDVTAVFPGEVGGNAGTTPVVIVFSEAMNPDSLTDAFEIVTVIGGIPDVPVEGVVAALVSDFRVLVLLPPTLDQGEYLVRVSADGRATDITGQLLDKLQGAQLGTFTVVPAPPDEPALVTTFPPADALSVSETVQIVAVFDRPIRVDTVDGSSFDVTVGDVDPPNDPVAVPLIVEGTSGAMEEPRVFLYRSVGPGGVPAPLGQDGLVRVTLSPIGAPILDEDGDPLAGSAVSFRTLSLAVPVSAALTSQPTDAIGLANLTAGDPRELMLTVMLEAGEPGDALDVFIFGESKATVPQLIALQRMLSLEGVAPITSAVFTLEDLALLLSSDPADTRVADGAVAFAFRSRRGALTTPVRVLDVDPLASGVTDPLLDTTAPEVSELLVPGGSTALFRSDQRGISIAGRASEEIRSVEVSTPLGDNGMLPSAIGGDENGLFLAAPVPAGVLASGSTSFSLIAYDAAFNPSGMLTGSFEQVGAVGPGALVPGDTLEVLVFDERTLAPLSNAFVLVHGDLGNGTDYPFHLSGETGPDGTITLSTPGAPSLAPVVTVVRSGYDLFTLHGVPSVRLGVPLRSSGAPGASASGAARSSDPGVVALFPGLDQRFDDSRRPFDIPDGFTGETCGGGVGSIACGYGPEPIASGRLGARSVFAGDFSLTGSSFSAALVIQAFGFRVPLGPSRAGVDEEADLDVPFMLTDARVSPEEAAVELPATVFRVDPGSGVTGTLDDDPATTGVPFASVESLVPGIPGALATGMGLSFDLGGARWLVRSAQPGAVTPTGPLGSAGIVDDDPFVRIEFRDQAGNAAGVRPRGSTIEALGMSAEFAALPVPRLVAPAPGGNTGGEAFTLGLFQAIDDPRGENGLYLVELLDEAGRGWTLWRIDPPGTGDVLVRAPDLGDAGQSGLADGDLGVQTASFAWADLDPTVFLWSDVGREPDLLSFSQLVTIVKP